MGIYMPHLRDEIIIPTLKELDLCSESAVNLLLGTAAQESHMGHYLKQLGKGPALSIYQIEPFTHKDLWRFIFKRKKHAHHIPEMMSGHMPFYEHGKAVALGSASEHSISLNANEDNFQSLCLLGEDNLIYNLQYATAMARIFYLRVPAKLPEADDWEGHSAYWKKYYNTHLGKGTTEEFLQNAKRFGLVK